MIILGLDPGIARCGFGLIDTTKRHSYLTCGILTTPTNLSVDDRLHSLGQDLEVLINTYHPDLAVVEHIFFGKNKQTAILTAQARGVLIYLLRNHHIQIESLTPLQIKSRLTGYGSAPKSQIQAVVTNLLSLKEPPQPDDAADALAAALCMA